MKTSFILTIVAALLMLNLGVAKADPMESQTFSIHADDPAWINEYGEAIVSKQMYDGGFFLVSAIFRDKAALSQVQKLGSTQIALNHLVVLSADARGNVREDARPLSEVLHHTATRFCTNRMALGGTVIESTMTPVWLSFTKIDEPVGPTTITKDTSPPTLPAPSKSPIDGTLNYPRSCPVHWCPRSTSACVTCTNCTSITSYCSQSESCTLRSGTCSQSIHTMLRPDGGTVGIPVCYCALAAQ